MDATTTTTEAEELKAAFPPSEGWQHVTWSYRRRDGRPTEQRIRALYRANTEFAFIHITGYRAKLAYRK